MKRKTKLKNLGGDETQDGSCHGNDVSVQGSQSGADGPAVRRSSRKRSVPKEFVSTTKRSKGYWSIKQKQKLLKVLEELNDRKLPSTNWPYRYPLPVIRKRVGGKSLVDAKRFMRMLEHRAAKAALIEMKQQPPLESWRQMSDKMTVLSGDDCCRHLIKVCNVMALECKDLEDGPGKVGVKRPETTSVTVVSNQPSESSETATPTEKTPFNQVPEEARASGAALPESSQSLEGGTASSSAAGTNTARVPDSQTSASGEAAASSSERTDAAPAAPAAETAAEDSEDIQVIPDYASIYKYIANLMRGECKQLGPLESLIVLDCLKLVEEHLKGRDNTKEKEGAQERFLDILQKFYLSMDCEDASVNEKTRATKDGDPTEPITMADLMGLRNQSQPGVHQTHQLGVEALLNDQSGSSSSSQAFQLMEACETTVKLEDMSDNRDQSESCSRQASQSNASDSEFVTIPEATCKRLQLKDIGLGSLNPFSIPLSLLDIRKGK